MTPAPPRRLTSELQLWWGPLVGLWDKAIVATLGYTACRAGAVAKLRLGDFQFDGEHFVLRFQEKGGKSREIPVRYDLTRFIRAYLEAAGISEEPKDRPLSRAGNGRSKELIVNAMDSRVVCDLEKRRLKDAGLPSRLSPHSFRVAAITNLLTQECRSKMFNIWPGMRNRERPGRTTGGRRK